MNHTDRHETAKNTKNNKDAEKSFQELYDKYIRKGDEAIIAEDIILAEKYYQYADHYLRCMNDPYHFGNVPKIQHSTSSHPMEKLIGKALKGIMAERAARKEAFMEKARAVAWAAKATKPEQEKKQDKAVKTKAASRQRSKIKKIDKKRNDGGGSCKVIPFKSVSPYHGIERQS